VSDNVEKRSKTGDDDDKNKVDTMGLLRGKFDITQIAEPYNNTTNHYARRTRLTF
jgi:hypothetical protein